MTDNDPSTQQSWARTTDGQVVELVSVWAPAEDGHPAAQQRDDADGWWVLVSAAQAPDGATPATESDYRHQPDAAAAWQAMVADAAAEQRAAQDAARAALQERLGLSDAELALLLSGARS